MKVVASASSICTSPVGKSEGTMRTPTGDYRYLSGHFDGNELNLQTFDERPPVLLQRDLHQRPSADGHFYSGTHYHSAWSAAPANRGIQCRVGLN